MFLAQNASDDDHEYWRAQKGDPVPHGGLILVIPPR
jgi:hypothetical protein